MTTSRQSIRTLITDLTEIIEWGEAAEDANYRLQNQLAEKDATIALRDEQISNMNNWLEARNARILEQVDEIERLKAELSIFKTGGASPGNGET